MDNEIVYLNFYRCDRCGEEWEDAWDSEVDDDCPSCGKRHMTSYKSEPMYDKDLELSRYPNDILMGGGHRTCHKCGKTTFGSVEHRCSTNDKTVVEHVKADNTIMHMISEFDAKEWQFLSNTVGLLKLNPLNNGGWSFNYRMICKIKDNLNELYSQFESEITEQMINDVLLAICYSEKK